MQTPQEMKELIAELVERVRETPPGDDGILSLPDVIEAALKVAADAQKAWARDRATLDGLMQEVSRLQDWKAGATGAATIAYPLRVGPHTEEAYCAHKAAYERGSEDYRVGADIVSSALLSRRDDPEPFNDEDTDLLHELARECLRRNIPTALVNALTGLTAAAERMRSLRVDERGRLVVAPWDADVHPITAVRRALGPVADELGIAAQAVGGTDVQGIMVLITEKIQELKRNKE